MKKRIKAVLLFTLALSLIIAMPVFSSAAEEPEFTYDCLGDVDGNGKITVADARLALRYALELEENFSAYKLKAADFNEDGKIMVTDARDILRVALELADHPFDKAAFTGVLGEYTEIMNGAKTAKPGFTMINYYSIPGMEIECSDEDALEALMQFLEIEGVAVPDNILSREEAAENPFVAAADSDMARFPIFGNEKGCLLTDPRYMRLASSVQLENGNKKVTFTLIDELNPKPDSGDGIPASKVGSVFNLTLSDEINSGMSEILDAPGMEGLVGVSSYVLYKDCTVTLEYDPQTNQIVSLKQETSVSMVLAMTILDVEIDFLQNLFYTSEWYGFDY